MGPEPKKVVEQQRGRINWNSSKVHTADTLPTQPQHAAYAIAAKVCFEFVRPGFRTNIAARFWQDQVALVYPTRTLTIDCMIGLAASALR